MTVWILAASASVKNEPVVLIGSAGRRLARARVIVSGSSRREPAGGESHLTHHPRRHLNKIYLNSW